MDALNCLSGMDSWEGARESRRLIRLSGGTEEVPPFFSSSVLHAHPRTHTAASALTQLCLAQQSPLCLTPHTSSKVTQL